MTAGVEFLEIDGHRLRVSVQGSGSPLLLLMGIGGNIEMWEPLRDELGDFETIAFDAPGVGASSTPGLPLRMPCLARVTARLMRRLGYRRSHVLGVSFGGGARPAVRAQRPGARRPARTRRDQPRRCQRARTNGSLHVLASPRRYDSRSYLERVAPRCTADGSWLGPISSASRRPPGRPDHRACAATRGSWLRSQAGRASRGHNLRVPTLVLTDDDDPIVPAVNAHLLRWAISGARLIVIRGGTCS